MDSVNSGLFLSPHPLSQPASSTFPIAAITIDCDFLATQDTSGYLALTYTLTGEISHLAIPNPAPSVFTDLLWQHTCCELFIADPESLVYREFNFSPSGAWAIYDFNDYRQPAVPPRLPKSVKPEIRLTAFGTESLQVTVNVPASLLPDFAAPWLLGITAVLEWQDGTKQYWALHHARAQPDFHARESFTLRYHPAPSALSSLPVTI